MERIQICEENRFSVFVKTRYSEEYRQLERWHAWFTKRGIPSIITYTKSGYALYRNNLVTADGDRDDQIGTTVER